MLRVSAGGTSVHRCLGSNNIIIEQWRWLDNFFGCPPKPPHLKTAHQGGGSPLMGGGVYHEIGPPPPGAK